MAGFVKLYRTMQQSAFYKDSEYVHLWIHLLLSVNHAEKRIKIEKTSRFVTILPGQVLSSRDTLSAQTGISSSKVQRILKAFESEQQIEQQTFSKYRVISITNWHMYQCSEQQDEQQVNSNRTASEQQVNTNKNVKKEKNEEERKEVKRFVPPSVQEVEAYMTEVWPEGDAEKFVNHYTATGWMIGKNKMKDWKAAVRTWRGKNYGSDRKPELQKYQKPEYLRGVK